MLPIPRSAALAAASAAAGAVLFGVAAGGVASVDDELRAASAPSPANVRTVDYRAGDAGWDCPGHAAPRQAPARSDWDET